MFASSALSRRPTPRSLVLVGVLMAAVGGDRAAETCNELRSDCTVPNCIGSPTSVAKVSSTLVCEMGNDGVKKKPTNLKCGVKLSGTPCGPQLSTTLCTGDPTQSGCPQECELQSPGHDGLDVGGIDLYAADVERARRQAEAHPEGAEDAEPKLARQRRPVAETEAIRHVLSTSLEPSLERATRLAPADARAAIDSLIDGYSRVTSVVSRSTFQLTSFDYSGGAPVDTVEVSAGRIDYAAAGGSYRQDVFADTYFGGEQSFGFDGAIYWHRYGAMDLLSVREGDLDSLLTLPNPLFLPLELLGARTDDCPFCVVKLPALAEPSTWEAVRSGFESSGRATSDRAIADLAGPSFWFTPSTFRVYASADGSGRLTRIEQLDGSGRPFRVLVMSGFRTVRGPKASVVVPHVIDLYEDLASIEEPVARRWQFVLDSVEVNGRIDPALFAPPVEETAYVFDEDARSWLRHPEPEYAALAP